MNPKRKPGFYLSSISVIFLLIDIQQASQTKVCDLDVVGRLHQDVSGSQVSVDKPPFLQIHHTLQSIHTHTQTAILNGGTFMYTNIQVTSPSVFNIITITPQHPRPAPLPAPLCISIMICVITIIILLWLLWLQFPSVCSYSAEKPSLLQKACRCTNSSIHKHPPRSRFSIKIGAQRIENRDWCATLPLLHLLNGSKSVSQLLICTQTSINTICFQQRKMLSSHIFRCLGKPSSLLHLCSILMSRCVRTE